MQLLSGPKANTFVSSQAVRGAKSIHLHGQGAAQLFVKTAKVASLLPGSGIDQPMGMTPDAVPLDSLQCKMQGLCSSGVLPEAAGDCTPVLYSDADAPEAQKAVDPMSVEEVAPGVHVFRSRLRTFL